MRGFENVGDLWGFGGFRGRDERGDLSDLELAPMKWVASEPPPPPRWVLTPWVLKTKRLPPSLGSAIAPSPGGAVRRT